MDCKLAIELDMRSSGKTESVSSWVVQFQPGTFRMIHDCHGIEKLSYLRNPSVRSVNNYNTVANPNFPFFSTSTARSKYSFFCCHSNFSFFWVEKAGGARQRACTTSQSPEPDDGTARMCLDAGLESVPQIRGELRGAHAENWKAIVSYNELQETPKS